MFLIISQISQENICAEASYLKSTNLIKETLTEVLSYEILQSFKNTYI